MSGNTNIHSQSIQLRNNSICGFTRKFSLRN